jgi:hypothetical protein
MNEGKTSFERLLSATPEGKELGALVRGGEIKSALDLLRLAFLYLTEGKSFSGTAALLQLAGIRSITNLNVRGTGRSIWRTPTARRRMEAAKRIAGRITR